MPASSLVVSLGKALTGLLLLYLWVVRLVVTGGSLIRRPKKVPSLYPGRGILTNK